MALVGGAVVAVAVGLFLVSRVVGRLTRRRSGASVQSMVRAGVGGRVGAGSGDESDRRRRERNRSLSAQQERMWRDQAKQTADLTAANQRRNQESMKRTNDRMRADAERAARSAIKRSRGW
jgi:hypothetical protein